MNKMIELEITNQSIMRSYLLIIKPFKPMRMINFTVKDIITLKIKRMLIPSPDKIEIHISSSWLRKRLLTYRLSMEPTSQNFTSKS